MGCIDFEWRWWGGIRPDITVVDDRALKTINCLCIVEGGGGCFCITGLLLTLSGVGGGESP